MSGRVGPASGLEARAGASLGIYNERDDIDHLVATLRDVAGDCRQVANF